MNNHTYRYTLSFSLYNEVAITKCLRYRLLSLKYFEYLIVYNAIYDKALNCTFSAF